MSLGCLDSQVHVYDRGGEVRLGTLDSVIRLQYGRVRDDISSALLTIQNPSSRCCDLLSDLQAGRHELVIFRGDDRVWEGPITRLAFGSFTVTIEARDVWHYAYRTILRNEYNNSYPNTAYVTDRAEKMLLAELARKEDQDPPINVLPYLDVRTSLTTARTARRTLRRQKTLWEEIDNLAAKAGMDYTAVGRAMVLWDTHEPIGQTEVLNQDDFLGDVILTQYGMDLATQSTVTDGEGRWGTSGGADEYYGLVEILETAYEEERTQGNAEVLEEGDIVTEAEMISQAKRNLDGRYPTPQVVRVPDSSALNPATSLNFTDLVPGVFIPVEAHLGCRTMTQIQKLDSVKVTQSPEDGERVSVVLSPAPGAQSYREDEGGESS